MTVFHAVTVQVMNVFAIDSLKRTLPVFRFQTCSKLDISCGRMTETADMSPGEVTTFPDCHPAPLTHEELVSRLLVRGLKVIDTRFL